MPQHSPRAWKMRSRHAVLAFTAGLFMPGADLGIARRDLGLCLQLHCIQFMRQAHALEREIETGTRTAREQPAAGESAGGAAGASGGSGGAGNNGGGEGGGGHRDNDDTDSGVVVRSSGGSEQGSLNRGAVSYDAARNMLQLRVPIESHEARGVEGIHSHQSSHSERGTGGLSAIGLRNERDGRRQLENFHLQALNREDLRSGKSYEALERAVRPIQTHYQRSIAAEHPKGTTVVTKTRFAIGTLSFSPSEVLALGLDPASVERAKALGFTVDSSTQVPRYGAQVVRLAVPPGIDAIRAQELLSNELPGQRFELNKIYRLYRAAMRDELGAPKKSEPLSPPGAPQCAEDRCFDRKIIKWQDRLSSCARGLRVGVIDTGFDMDHPAFRGRNIHRNRFEPVNRPAAPDWHGTGVLSVLAGNSDSGTPGLIPDAEFYAASIFFIDEGGRMATDTVSLLKALDWMKASDAQIINMSFSGPRDNLVEESIEKMSSNGVVFVAAAGNEGPTAEPSYPAAYPQVVAVTAVTNELRNYRYANRGEHIDVAAPGVDIWSAVPGAREGYHTGTSFAAPHVTAILSVLPREQLQRRKEEILDGIPVLDLGESGRDPVYGRGLLLAPTACVPPVQTVASAEK